ncbi:MAG: hypothetical protein H3C32_13440, partial [Anaerolineae bacterium]|nr:hypothetical protein [Anaerolineae bacterium]
KCWWWLSGDTYPHRDLLKRHGARFSSRRRAWYWIGEALADYDQALELLRDVPLGKAATLNNRANVYRDLSTVDGEDRRARLQQALHDAAQAYEIFAAHRHTINLPIARLVLGSICRQIVGFLGIAALEEWWSELTGSQPLPEWLRPPSDVSLTQDEFSRLSNLLIEWVRTPDWQASKAFLVEHQSDLLTYEADNVIWALIQVNPDAPVLEQRRALLRTARETGIDAAYDQIR